VTTFVPAERPEGAPAEGATVGLKLTVDAQGSVGDAEVVVSAGEALDAAALAAVRRFIFEPARRDGEPIAARIRYDYVFAPARPLPPPPSVAPAPRTGRLEGRIRTRAADLPLAGALVTVSPRGAAAPLASTLTDEQGAFRFAALAPGSYVVHVEAQGAASVDHAEGITAGEATVITYRLEAAVGGSPSTDGAGSGAYAFGATALIAAPPRETTKRTLAPEELTAAAGTRGDPLRVIELLPGVARPPELAGFLLIRGSGPDDSEVIFEGGPVDHLYHFGGLTSFTNGRLLDHIDLYPGNFSVRYGRKIGGIVDVGLRDPRSDAYHGLVDVNLIDATVMAEGPVGARSAFVVSARRSYIDFWFRDVIPQDALGVTAAPVYDDYQAMFTHRTESGGRLRVLLFGSSDVFKLNFKNPADDDPTVRGAFGQEYGVRRLQASWRQMFAGGLEQEITAGVGTLTIRNEIGGFALDVSGVDGLLRAEWRAPVGPWVKLIAGFDGYALTGDVSYDGPIIQQVDGNPANQGPLTGLPLTAFHGRFTTLRPAAYTEALVQVGERWLLVPGLRADYYSEISASAVSPRLTTRFKVAPRTVLKAGAGLFSQPPQYGETLPGLGNPHLGLTYAQQYSVGVEQALRAHASVGLETFYKRLSDVEVNGVDDTGRVTQVNGGRGRIYGLEVLARLEPVGRAFGFVSYTLSRSERNDHGEGWRLYDYDQTHILTVTGGSRLPRAWELSATFRLTSGNPRTPIVGSVYDANSDYYVPTYGAVNSARDPLFHQLSVRAEKTWRFKAWRLATYLDVQNVYNHRSQEGLQYSYDYRNSAPIAGLPVLPSLGVRGEL
jgi:TonB family protein